MIAALVVMIFLHELGHFLTAKAAGMKVTEFFIGFGPRIWSFRRGETEYGLKVIPAGAYVKIIGMHNLDEFDPADADRTYMSKPFWRRLSVAVAGSTMHFLLALVCFFARVRVRRPPGRRLLMTADELDALEATRSWSASARSRDDSAAAARRPRGRRHRSSPIDGEPVDGFDEFRERRPCARRARRSPSSIERDGELVTPRRPSAPARGRRPASGVGFFGVGPRLETPPTRPSASPRPRRDGRRLRRQSVGETFRGLGQHPVARAGSPTSASRPSRRTTSDHGARSAAAAAAATGRRRATSRRLPASSVSASPARRRPARCRRVRRLPLRSSPPSTSSSASSTWCRCSRSTAATSPSPCYEKVRSMLQGGRATTSTSRSCCRVTYAVVLVLAFLGISTIVLDIADPRRRASRRCRSQAASRGARPARVTLAHPTNPVVVGGGAPISVQSMTITKTADVEGTLAQIYALYAAGADIVRCTCNEIEAAEGLARIVPRSPVPIVADIHHQYKMALAALDAGVACLRLNPGNIRRPEHIKAVAAECRDRAGADPHRRQRRFARPRPLRRRAAASRPRRWSSRPAGRSPTSTRSASTSSRSR